MNSGKLCCHCEIRVFVLLAVVAGLIDGQCEALTLEETQYNRVLIACRDKLESWTNVSTAAETPSNNDDNSRSAWYTKGVFMRGKWKQVSNVHFAHAIRPSFLSSDQGMFDFFSSQWTGAIAVNGSMIPNISGQLFFRDSKDQRAHPGSILSAKGVYNKELGELCMIGCVQKPLTFGAAPAIDDSQNVTNITDNGNRYKPFDEENGQDCSIRGLLTVSGSSRLGRKIAKGSLESLKNVSDSEYFTIVSLAGSMVNNKDQQSLYHLDLSVRAALFVIEAVIIICQIIHSIRSPSSYFVSMLMIIVQIVVMCFLALHLIYLPIRLLTYQRFKYLISSLALVPWVVLAAIILLNFLFFWVVFRKRRVAKRLNIEERPQELILAAVCMIVYAITGVVLRSLQNFETYLQVVWCWFLLPQVIANVFWDLRMKPLLWIYLVGVSLCRIVYIGFNALRPTIYGYDDLNDFPHSWFWGITGTVILFASYALLQQRYGGRSFLPQRWFGYQQLPSSKTEANHSLGSIGTVVDRMIEL